jgi:hypothetical protein
MATMNEEQKVATEVAEQEFARWAYAMDLNFDPKGLDDEDKENFRRAKERLVRAMEAGHLVVDGEGRMVYTPQIANKAGERTPLVWNEPRGGDLAAMDQKKAGHDVARMYAVMARMTGVLPITFDSMVARDLKVCQAIVTLFLGS